MIEGWVGDDGGKGFISYMVILLPAHVTKQWTRCIDVFDRAFVSPKVCNYACRVNGTWLELERSPKGLKYNIYAF